MLHVLRSLVRVGGDAIVAHGESVWPILGLLREDLITEAFQKRRVQKQEKELREAWDRVNVIVAVAPSGFPVGKLSKQLLACVPELGEAIIPQKHFIGVVAEQDSSRSESKDTLSFSCVFSDARDSC